MVGKLSALEIELGNYNPDKDIVYTGGQGGIDLAEKVFTSTQGNFGEFSRLAERDKRIAYLLSLKKIASTGHSSIGDIKRILGHLRSTGYDVIPYSHMNKKQVSGYLKQIRGEISRELEELDYQNSFS